MQRPWGSNKFGVLKKQKGATVAGVWCARATWHQTGGQGVLLQGPEALMRS